MLRRVSVLSPEERGAAVEALVVVPIVRLALWILPSAMIIRRVREVANRRPSRRVGSTSRASITWATEAVSARIPGATCLTQAISAQLLLRRHGHPSRLCLGVAKSRSGSLTAHAWLEDDGTVLIGGKQVPMLTRLPEISGRGIAGAGMGQ